ncbi:MAG TPA: hypothetical protein VNZ45_09675 [Bacteroidia bacterium]|jgi:hypothetical protein|nr:hypothetical protein [Bacteroidia bacterium]
MKRTRRSMGGKTPANELPLGGSTAVRSGKSPGLEAPSGATLVARPGKSPGDDVSKGATLARRMNTGGGVGNDNGDKRNDGRERMALDEKRNKDLSTPFARGGHAKVHKDLHSIYKMLHKHFEGGPEDGYAKGGKLWIKDAVKHKGALHKSLHVPQGKKIPVSKLHKAEHSKSPTLRKQARLAETLRGFHHKPQGR